MSEYLRLKIKSRLRSSFMDALIEEYTLLYQFKRKFAKNQLDCSRGPRAGYSSYYYHALGNRELRCFEDKHRQGWILQWYIHETSLAEGLHRLTGPAVEYSDGTIGWWLFGQGAYTKKKHQEILKSVGFLDGNTRSN